MEDRSGAEAPALPGRDRRQGSFTDAAIELGISQAAVSRTLAALERHPRRAAAAPHQPHRHPHHRRRTGPRPRPASCSPRPTNWSGRPPPATPGCTSATPGRRWAATPPSSSAAGTTSYPEIELHLIRHNTPTGGLAEGLCDLAVIRAPVDTRRYAHALVGHERRYVALASDDPLGPPPLASAWTRSARRTLVVDRRTGTTTLDLWPADARPPWSTPTTSTTGSPPSPPAAASASPPRPPPPSTAATASPTARCATPTRSPSTSSGGAHDPHPATHAVVALAHRPLPLMKEPPRPGQLG